MKAVKIILAVEAVVIAGAIGVIGVAYGQPANPIEKPLTLTVTVPELNVIGKALGKMPFEDVAQLMAKLQQQVTQQQQSTQVAPPVPTPSEPAKP